MRIRKPDVPSIQKRRRNARQRGFNLVEMGLSLALMAGGAVVLMNQASKQASGLKDRIVAQKMQTITEAEKAYVKANYASLIAAAGPGAPIAVNITGPAIAGRPSVQSAGFLPPTFVNKNAYGQSAVMLIRQPVPNSLEVVTTTIGGSKIPDENLGNIAQMIGAGGGFMASNPVGGSTGKITGSFGGWSTPAATWSAGGGNEPAQGRVMSTLAFDSSGAATTGSWLSRVATGNPVDNRMSTAIDMNGNNLVGAAAITASSLAATGAVSGNTVAAATSMAAPIFYDSQNTTFYVDPASTSRVNAVIATGKVESGTIVSAATSMAAPVYYDLNDGSYYVDPASTSRVNNINATGAVTATGAITSSGQVTGSSLRITGLATVGNSCSPNGQIFIDTTGSLLVCVSGVVTKYGSPKWGTPVAITSWSSFTAPSDGLLMATVQRNSTLKSCKVDIDGVSFFSDAMGDIPVAVASGTNGPSSASLPVSSGTTVTFGGSCDNIKFIPFA